MNYILATPQKIIVHMSGKRKKKKKLFFSLKVERKKNRNDYCVDAPLNDLLTSLINQSPPYFPPDFYILNREREMKNQPKQQETQ